MSKFSLRRTSHRRLAVGLLLGQLLFVALLLSPRAHAGLSTEHSVGSERFGSAAIQQFTLELADALDARQAGVALLARSGRPRDQLPSGVRFTHVAIAVFEAVRRTNDPEPVYLYTVYNLYQGAEGKLDRSYLKQDTLYDFVNGTYEREIGVLVPGRDLQARLLRVIRSDLYRHLHNPAYNLVANPAVDRYDNCVTHTLKLCMAAIYDSTDRKQIYAAIQAHFRPTKIRTHALQRLGTHFIEGLSLSDQRGSTLETATFESLAACLQDNGLVEAEFEVRLGEPKRE